MELSEAEFIVARNHPWCDQWDEQSFCATLHEYARWDYDEYWKLEAALYRLSEAEFDRYMAYMIFKIFSDTKTSLYCQFDQDDVFRIKDIEKEEVRELIERLDLVFLGCFEGKMPSQEWFEKRNPLVLQDV